MMQKVKAGKKDPVTNLVFSFAGELSEETCFSFCRCLKLQRYVSCCYVIKYFLHFLKTHFCASEAPR